MIKLSPSLLAANPLCLGEEVLSAAVTGCDELHYDVMDAHFVPNLSFGPHILKALRMACPLTMDVHLMLDRPMEMLEQFARAGADIITVHAEAEQTKECLEKIHALGLKAGLSVKPGTSVESISGLLPLCNRVLIMTVEPGFGGQKLMTDVLDKAVTLHQYGFAGDIEADGGINVDNAPELVKKGINVLVMGTAFFQCNQREKLVKKIHAL